MRVLVLTVVHHPEDARVYGRQIISLLEAGHDVDYAAPWSAYQLDGVPGVEAIDSPRAEGRSRWAVRPWLREFIKHSKDRYDLAIFHNPELIPPMTDLAERIPVVFDVHEDTVASLPDKRWLPKPLRAPFASMIRRWEQTAEQSMHIILAEAGYQDRFRLTHPVVPNEPIVPENVPPPASNRVVHLGRHSKGRGAIDLIDVAERLAGTASLELLGWADDDVRSTLEQASQRGDIEWSGRLGNQEALGRIEGAGVGVSALHDLPNYRHSRPTKIVEYMSRGIPVVTTPLPIAVEIVRSAGCGLVVPFEDPEAIGQAIISLLADDVMRTEMGAKGHRTAYENYNWDQSGPRFVRLLESWSR